MKKSCDIFKDILQDPSQHPVLVSCVLDAIAYGQPLPSLVEHLIAIVRDNTRPDSVREDALSALQNAHPDPTPVLLRLLNEINSGIIVDEKRRLRGELLSVLYLKKIGPSEVVNYLVDEHPNFSGKYTLFLDHQLVENTSYQELPALLDAIAQSDLPPKHAYQCTWQRSLGRLLVRGLKENGEQVSTGRLYDWLGIVLNEYGSPTTDREYSDAIRQWLDQHPGKIEELFWHWRSATPPERVWQEEHMFWVRLHLADRPTGFAQFLLERAQNEANERIADFLFREAVCLRTQYNRPDAPTLEELIDYIEQNTRFGECLQSELYCEIPDWCLEQAQRRRHHQRERETALKGRIEWLSKEIDKIRAGTSDSLTFLAKIYFGLFADVDHDASPFDRLAAETNKEIAEAAVQGFVASLRRHELPTPGDIGELYVKARYNISYVLLAGMDIIASRSLAGLIKLPHSTLSAALVFHYANTTGHDRAWVCHLLTSEPSLAARALQAFWSPQLARRAQPIPGLYGLAHEDFMAEVARQIAVPLLRAYPRCATQYLDSLLKAAVRHGDRNALIELARQVLAAPGRVGGAHRALWYAFAYLLRPDEFRKKIDRYVGRDPQKAGTLLQVGCPSWSRGHNPEISLSTEDQAFLIKVVGRIFKPSDTEPKKRDPSGGYKVTDRMEAARSVHSLIQNLSNDISAEATDALALLGQDPKLTEWRESLAHAIALQARRRREAQFRYPTGKEVAGTLRQGPPVNAADLQTVVAHHLRTLGEELRHGPTDGYKTFWNVDSHGKPTTPRPENDCRDRILDRLRPELSKLGINAEPEGHYAQDKRADIKALCVSMNLPVEIKRHYHKDLWTAPLNQLKKLYSRDPGTGDRGIYLVLWFGLDFKGLPKLPSGITLPTRPADLETALRELLPEAERVLLETIVLDCSQVKG